MIQLISALIGKQGPSREILRLCLDGKYKPIISNTLFLEYEDVSSRAKIKKLCPLTETEISELIRAIYNICEWVPIYYLWRPNLKDEGDSFLVELAIAGNANIIVTNNIKDLGSAELSFDNLQIFKPEQLLTEVNKDDDTDS